MEIGFTDTPVPTRMCGLLTAAPLGAKRRATVTTRQLSVEHELKPDLRTDADRDVGASRDSTPRPSPTTACTGLASLAGEG